MPPPAEAHIERIAALIGEYWCANPSAEDLAEGVAWWVPELADVPPAWIRKALERLVQRGLAVARPLPDGRTSYANGRRCKPPSP
jgi:hypothetical protein